MQNKNIVFTGDNTDMIQLYSQTFSRVEFTIKHSGCIAKCDMRLKEIWNQEIALIVVIWDFKNMADGIYVVDFVRRHCSKTPILVIGDDNVDEEELKHLHIDGFVKNTSDDSLVGIHLFQFKEIVERLLSQRVEHLKGNMRLNSAYSELLSHK